jgi:hypothetical protein
MKTFYHYENGRKRYTASYSAGEQILYTVEYKVKQTTIFKKRIFNWVPLASLRSMKKFQDIKYLLDIKVYDDRMIKLESRRVYINPFLEYQEDLKYR